MSKKIKWFNGKVLWFNDLKGEGLITDKEGKNFFFHYSCLKYSKGKRKSIKEDKEVKFSLYENSFSKRIDEVKEV